MTDREDTKPDITMKTLALDLPIEVHERIEAILARRIDQKASSKKSLGFEALNIGLNVMESTLAELDAKAHGTPDALPEGVGPKA